MIFLLSCGDEEVPNMGYPRLRTLEVSEISENGATFNAEVFFLGQNEIIDFGFVWSRTIPFLTGDRVVFLGEMFSTNFSARITTTLEKGRRYNVKAFLRTDELVIFGEVVTFTSQGSQAPQIERFSPAEGTWGDTIKVFGQGFSYVRNTNQVNLGQLIAPIIGVTDSLLEVVVPSSFNDSIVDLSVTILNKQAVATERFRYLVPKVFNISPVYGTFRDTVTVTGNNFSAQPDHQEVLIGGWGSALVSVSVDELQFIIPDEINHVNNPIQIRSVGYTLDYDSSFHLAPPEILDVVPDTIDSVGQIISISGRNFSPVLANNNVYIRSRRAGILEADIDQLKVRIPPGVFNPPQSVKSVTVHVITVEQSVVWTKQLVLRR